MASKRHVRRKACGHKVRHASAGDALKHLRALRAEGGRNLETYRCRFCRQWHVGHYG